MEVVPCEAPVTEAAESQRAEGAPEINFNTEKRLSQSDMPSLDLFDSESMEKPCQEDNVAVEEKENVQDSANAGEDAPAENSEEKREVKSVSEEGMKSVEVDGEGTKSVEEDKKSADGEGTKSVDRDAMKGAESEVVNVEEKVESLNQPAEGVENLKAVESVTISSESVEDIQKEVSEEITERIEMPAAIREDAEINERNDNKEDNREETGKNEENANTDVATNNQQVSDNHEEAGANCEEVIQDAEVKIEKDILDKSEDAIEENQYEKNVDAENFNEAAVNVEESAHKDNTVEIIDNTTPNTSSVSELATPQQHYVIDDSDVKDEPQDSSIDSIAETMDTVEDAVGTEESSAGVVENNAAVPVEVVEAETTVVDTETTVVEIAEPQEVTSSEYVQEVSILESSSEAESAVAEILPREEYEHSENVEYQVILSDGTSDVTMNGVHETDKQVFQGQVIEIAKTEAGDIVAFTGDIQSSESYIAIPSETVTEVTFADQQVMVLPDLAEEQMIVMEAECEQTEDEVEEDDKMEEKEKLVNIPCHVLGRSVDKPLVDPVKNGRVLLKPRLGVKIPYRNLTSQIVSKQEIAEELMERSRIRQSNADPPAGGDVFFAQKLAQRLARKLDPPTPSTSKRESRSKSASANSSQKSHPHQPVNPPAPKEKVIDNSDLIALLEGDDVPDWNIARKDIPIKEEEVKPLPEWEKEIALKQLKELPKISRMKNKGKELSRPSPRIVEVSKPVEKEKSNVVEKEKAKVVEKEKTPKVQEKEKTPKVVEKASKVEKSLKAVEKIARPVEKQKEVEKKEKESVLEDDEKDLIEPRFSSMQVVKTYTRKRKPLADDLISFISPKKPVEKSVEEQPPTLKPQKPINQPTSVSKTPPSKTPVNAKKTQKSITNPKPAPKVTPPVQKTPDVPKSSKPEKSENNTEGRKSPKPKEEKKSETPKADTPKLLSPNSTYISKSSRIVKRKKIWDPDEVTPSKLKSPKFEDKSPTTPSPEKKPKLLKPPEKPAVKEKPEPPLRPRLGRPPLRKTEKLLKKAKKMVKKKTRLTEVDRLLMDEGAVNMLYSVKNTEEILKQTKKNVISLDDEQEVLLNKTNEIKNDLQISSSKDSPISLRKKEATPKPKETTPKPSPIKEPIAMLRRKKSKDSMSGSVHSPPASPGFAFSQHADASRIIRRHSSSSFSSETNEDDQEKAQEKPKKEAKKKKKALGVDKQALTQEMTKNFSKSLQDVKNEGFSVRKVDNLVQIILTPDEGGLTILSAETLTELAKSLETLDKDDTCKVVLISSSGHSFCQGINYKELACSDKNELQTIADSFTAAVRSFLLSLTKFSKLLVAGVHGNTVGLGVTMLPLFDMVLASDTATFSAPYARLGCAVEGAALLALPHVMHNALASELFFASRKLTAAEALRWGLVTRTLWPDKFQEELVSVLKSTSEQSLQSMQTIKRQLRPHLSSVEGSLQSESETLVKCWMSAECQESFSKYSLEVK